MTAPRYSVRPGTPAHDEAAVLRVWYVWENGKAMFGPMEHWRAREAAFRLATAALKLEALGPDATNAGAAIESACFHWS